MDRVSLFLQILQAHSYFSFSEDEDEQMRQDDATPQKATRAKGDLSEYNLDGYDDDDVGGSSALIDLIFWHILK